MLDPEKLIQETGAVVPGHFVYKVGWAHGTLYMDKEQFQIMGARKLGQLIKAVGDNLVPSLSQCLKKLKGESVGIIGPAYGAIPFSLTLAIHLESIFPSIRFFPARTELTVDNGGRKVHTIPEKLLKLYRAAGGFIEFEDIVNNGMTIREVAALFEKAGLAILAATCFVDRGGQTAKTLRVKNYEPLIRKKMKQSDIRKAPCPQCQKEVPITTDLGKGAAWVEMFGQPPYPEGEDFSAFWE